MGWLSWLTRKERREVLTPEEWEKVDCCPHCAGVHVTRINGRPVLTTCPFVEEIEYENGIVGADGKVTVFTTPRVKRLLFRPEFGKLIRDIEYPPEDD